MKKIKKSFWRAYWKLHDKKKMLVARLKGYLDGLPPKTRRRIVLAMLAAFAVLALYTFGKAVYDIGRNDGSRMVIDLSLIHISEPTRLTWKSRMPSSA